MKHLFLIFLFSSTTLLAQYNYNPQNHYWQIATKIKTDALNNNLYYAVEYNFYDNGVLKTIKYKYFYTTEVTEDVNFPYKNKLTMCQKSYNEDDSRIIEEYYFKEKLFIVIKKIEINDLEKEEKLYFENDTAILKVYSEKDKKSQKILKIGQISRQILYQNYQEEIKKYLEESNKQQKIFEILTY